VATAKQDFEHFVRRLHEPDKAIPVLLNISADLVSQRYLSIGDVEPMLMRNLLSVRTNDGFSQH
jgi:hypothetical protein